MNRSIAHAETRMHPADAAVPIDHGSFVPWIASWSPPDQPGGRCGWIPLMPNANAPYELEAGNGTLSVTS